MADKLSDKARDLLQRPVIASVATLAKDGAPQITPVWIDVDGDDLLFNTAKGRAKTTNIARDPRLAVSVVDPNDPYNVVVVRGTAVDISHEGADAHIDALAKKYLDVEEYPMRQPGEVRLKIRVRADRIVMQSA